MKMKRRPISPTETYEAYEHIVKKFKEIDEHLDTIMNEPEMKRAYIKLHKNRQNDLITTAHTFYKYIAELTGRMQLMKEKYKISEPQIQTIPKTENCKHKWGQNVRKSGDIFVFGCCQYKCRKCGKLKS